MKQSVAWKILLGTIAGLAILPAVLAQRRPYIGYAYPAGGQQCMTFQVRLGGQDLDEVNAVVVSGTGVTARVSEYLRRLNNQEVQLLNEQLKELKKTLPPAPTGKPGAKGPVAPAAAVASIDLSAEGETRALIAKIEQRTREFVQTPACASLSNIVVAEVTIAPDAEPGVRELRLVTTKGVSNPLVFYVGQLPEYARAPMLTATIQILGKEAQALRKRPTGEAEDRITIPCTVNGQIASGEVNRYRFSASKGQRLVISAQGQQLIPYIADAVPGWFQPVLALYDSEGREVAFDDDYRFRPDPVILYEVPRDGDYVFAIFDSIYRGREDFVYRITVGEMPFLTSLFPLGGQVGAALPPNMEGWNLPDADLAFMSGAGRPGVQWLMARRMGYVSNPVPFAVDSVPDVFDREPNNSAATAQKVTLPVVVNGRIDRPDDTDVFAFTGKANQTVVVEVQARRLDSPLDSVVRLTDANGTRLGFSDDCEDLTAGLNTHQADSYLMVKLPADGTYYVHIGDTARKGGAEYGYRLRISAPQPDFELRAVPSSVSLAINSTAAVTVYAVRKDGFTGPIKLALKDPPPGFTAGPVTLAANQKVARFAFKGGPTATKGPVQLSIVGSTKVGEQEVVHEAVPAEDRMQAFLWRQLVPANDLQAVVFDPAYQPPSKRPLPVQPAVLAALPTATPVVASTATPAVSTAASTAAAAAAKPKFTKQQIVGRLRELKRLYEEGLLTDTFYTVKVGECEAAQ